MCAKVNRGTPLPQRQNKSYCYCTTFFKAVQYRFGSIVTLSRQNCPLLFAKNRAKLQKSRGR